MLKGKKPKKWNRAHFFQRKKSTKNKVGHPVFVYGTRGNMRKYLVFTHTPENDNEGEKYEKLKYNINPKEQGKRDSWVKKTYEVSRYDSLREPDEKYRIHDSDKDTIKKYRR